MKEPSTETLIIEHHYELYRTVARLCGGVNGQSSSYEWARAKPGNAYPNFIMNESAKGVDLQLLRRDLSSDVLPPFWFSPNAALGQQIGQLGFRKIQEWQGMAMKPEELITPPPVPEFEWIPVEAEEKLDIWTQLVASQFNATYEAGYFYPLLADDRFELFLGYQSGLPVATSMNFYWQQAVGVHMVSTHEQYRRRGIGQRAFYESLKTAFDKGARLGLCTAVPKGANAWQRIGFKIYTKLYLYWLVSKKYLSR